MCHWTEIQAVFHITNISEADFVWAVRNHQWNSYQQYPPLPFSGPYTGGVLLIGFWSPANLWRHMILIERRRREKIENEHWFCSFTLQNECFRIPIEWVGNRFFTHISESAKILISSIFWDLLQRGVLLIGIPLIPPPTSKILVIFGSRERLFSSLQ